MRLNKPASIAIASLLLCVADALRAQNTGQADDPKHCTYKFVDLGTFGGPWSAIPFLQHTLTKQGRVIGTAETDIPDPFAPNCASPNCKVPSGFTWRNGVMTQLPGLSVYGESTAQALNGVGTVVGDSENGLVDPASGLPEINAVRWKNGEIESLGTLGGNSSSALSISKSGLIAGWSETGTVDSAGDTVFRAFLWRNGVMHNLGSLGGSLSFGADVNDRGQVVGFSLVDPTTTHPFFWDKGHMTDLSLGGSQGGSGVVNSHGQAIGDSTLPGDLEDHAFFWSGGKVHDLGTLGGTFSQPTGLTEDGHISGVATTTNEELLHAVLWRNRKIKDLGTVPGDTCSWAWGLNSKDQVVGISLPAPCDFSVAHAFLWDRGSMVDLNKHIPPDSGLQLVFAKAINEAGEIVGAGVPPGISPADVEVLGHAFVLIPQAEPCNLKDEEFNTDTSNTAKTLVSETTRAAVAAMVRRFGESQLRKILNVQETNPNYNMVDIDRRSSLRGGHIGTNERIR